jgi:hypothetical protein
VRPAIAVLWIQATTRATPKTLRYTQLVILDEFAGDWQLRLR